MMRILTAAGVLLVVGSVVMAQATRPSAGGSGAGNAPAGAPGGPATRPATTDPERMLKQLLTGNRPSGALNPVDYGPEKTNPNEPKVGASKHEHGGLIREGTILPDRVGRLTKTADGQWYELTLEADGVALQDPPLLLLPNLKLMTMERQLRDNSRDLRFRVTGTITEYNGRNYILLDKLVMVESAKDGGK
jgi:hypothetical protein